MRTVERGCALLGLVAVVLVVMYWQTVKLAWQNRKTLEQVNQGANLYAQLKDAL